MRFKIRYNLAVVLALPGVLHSFAPTGVLGADPKLRVVCTTTMIADMARNIAGDRAEIFGIMKPGEDPHVYAVRPRDVQLIARADVVLMNGLHLESTLQHVIENNARDALVIRLAESKNIIPLESEQARGAPDPHCWMNVEYFRIYAERARDALIQADPGNAEHYRKLTATYVEELRELHTWVGKRIGEVDRERRVMVTSHDAFQYLGDAYSVDVFAVIGISTEQQPKPRDIDRLESLVRQRGVRALFVETSVSQTLNQIVEKIARLTGARIGGTLYSDSLGEEGALAGTYIGMVRHNVSTIVDALR